MISAPQLIILKASIETETIRLRQNYGNGSFRLGFRYKQDGPFCRKSQDETRQFLRQLIEDAKYILERIE